MPPAENLALFAAAALALLLVPGPAVLYVVAQSIRGGRRAGLVSVLGLHIGSLVHVGAAAVGLSSLLASSATAFTAVKYAGAAYLVVLGLRRLVGGRHDSEPAVVARHGRLLRQGFVVNVLNPKTALFFLAFLPQFVDVDAAAAAIQIVVFGLAFVVLGLVTDGAWALAAGTAGGLARRSRRVVRAERYLSGSVFVGLGVATALSGSRGRT